MATEGTALRELHGLPVRLRRRGRSSVAQLVILSLLTQMIAPALAQVTVDRSSPPQNRAALDRAANGVPVVNIATPGRTGLSHNKFSSFDVPSQGVVLNNGATVSQSKLGGLILGNPNLAQGKEASLILNEVTSTRRSQLNGYLEVAGSQAGVVVANPNGITCNGCGFLETPRATLVTGRPAFGADGSLRNFSIDGGDISVQGELDATRAEKLDLVSRKIDVNAPIHANDLFVGGGRQDFDYSDRSVSAKAGVGPSEQPFFMDSSEVGGMYAGRIRIVGTDANVGMRLPGNVATSTGDMVLIADGRIVTKNASSARNLIVQSTGSDVEVGGAAYSGRSASINAVGNTTVGANGVVGAKDNVSVTTHNLAIGAGGAVASNLNENGSTFVGTGTTRVNTSGNVIVGSHALLHGGQELSVEAQGRVTNDGRLQSGQDLDVHSGTSIENAGSLTSPGSVLLNAGTNIANTSPGRVTAGTSLRATSDSLTNNGRMTSNGDATYQAAALNNSGQMTAVGSATLEVTDATNSGTVSGSTVQATATNGFTNTGSGRVLAADALTVRGNSLVNSGQLASNGTAKVGATTITTSGVVLGKNNLTLEGATEGTAANSISIAGGEVGSETADVSLSANTITNHATVAAGQDVAVHGGDSIENAVGGKIEAGRDVSLTTPGTLSNLGRVRANRDVSTDAASIASAEILAGRNVTAATDNLDNKGVVSAANAVNITGKTAAATLTNRAASQISGASVSATGFSQIDNRGVIGGSDSVMLSGDELKNAVEIDSQGSVDLDFSILTNNGLISGSSVTAFAGTLVNALDVAVNPLSYGGTMQATSLLRLDADSIINKGLLASGGVLSTSVDSLLNDHALIIARDDLTIEGLTTGTRASQIQNLSGTIESVAGNITLRADFLENIGDGVAELQVSEVRHAFAGSVPPPGLAFYPDLISPDGYFQLYDNGASQTYVWVPSPEKVQEILALEGITIDQWTPFLWMQYAPDAATFDPTEWAIYVPDEAVGAPANSFLLGREEKHVITTPNTPGQIISDNGGITIDAGLLHNSQSAVSANGSLTLNGGSVVNEGTTLTDDYSLSVSFANDTIRGEGWSRSNGTGETQWFAAGNSGPILVRSGGAGVIPSTVTATGSITGNLVGTFTNVGTPATDPDSLSFATTSTSLITPTSAAPATTASRVQIGNSSTPIAGISESALRAFAPAVDGSRFVVETRLPFINPGDYFGSDYFLSRLGANPDATLKFLGDAYFDTLIVRQQVLELTGRRFVSDGYLSDSEQMEALLGNGTDAIRRFGLSVGVALSPEMQAQLTKDAVIYVEATYQGKKVLVPQLYLAPSTIAKLDGRAAHVTGADIAVNAATIVNSDGTIAADNQLRLAGGRVVDVGGILKGRTVVIEGTDSVELMAQVRSTGNGDDRIGGIVGPRTQIDAGSLRVTTREFHAEGAKVNVANDATFVTNRFEVTPVEAEIYSRLKNGKNSQESYQRTLFIPEFTIGGNLDVRANDSALIRAATLNVGKDIQIHAGELLIDSGQQVKSSKGSEENKGLFAQTKSTWDYMTVTEVRTEMRANGSITLVTTVGDTTIRASVLDANSIAIDSKGNINIKAAYDQVHEQDTRTGSSFVWMSARDKGIDKAMVVETQLRARGGADAVSLQAKGAIVIQIPKTGDLNESIDTISQAPGLAWMKTIAERPEIQKQLVSDEFNEWNVHSEGLSGPAAALISIALAVATEGSGAALFGNLFGSATLSNVAFTSLVSQAAIGIANNKGNPAGALEYLLSTEYARSLATSMITAGLLENAGSILTGQETEFLGRLQNNFTRAGVQASVSTAIEGGDFGRNLFESLKYQAITTLGEQGAIEIGCASHGGPDCGADGAAYSPSEDQRLTAVSRYMAHAVLGCAVGATQGDCTSGAAGGVTGEALSSWFYDGLKGEAWSGKGVQEDVNDFLNRGVNIAKVGGAVAAFALGADERGVQIASTSAGSAAEHNSLAAPLLRVTGSFAAAVLVSTAIARCNANPQCGQENQALLAKAQTLLDQAKSENVDALNQLVLFAEVGGVILSNAAAQNSSGSPSQGRRPATGGQQNQANAAAGSPMPPDDNDERSTTKQRDTEDYLRRLGRDVRSNPEEGVAGAGRQGDVFVDGELAEIKNLDKGATSATIRNTVQNSLRGTGQARNIVIDARNSGLTQAEAERGIARALGIGRGKLDQVTVIGDDFLIRRGP